MEPSFHLCQPTEDEIEFASTENVAASPSIAMTTIVMPKLHLAIDRKFCAIATIANIRLSAAVM